MSQLEKELQEIKTDSQELIHLKLTKYKLRIIGFASTGMANLLSQFYFSLFGLVLVIVASIAAGFAISNLVGDVALGFGILSAAYFIILLAIKLINPEGLRNFIRDSIIKSIFKEINYESA